MYRDPEIVEIRAMLLQNFRVFQKLLLRKKKRMAAAVEELVDDWEALGVDDDVDEDGDGDEGTSQCEDQTQENVREEGIARDGTVQAEVEGGGRGENKNESLSLIPAARQTDSVFVNKIVVKEAPSGRAQPSTPSLSFCEVMYEGRLLLKNGEVGAVFDSSFETGIPYVAEIGAGKVIRAWDMVLPTMRVGERCRLQCSSDYAYGEAGSAPDIPPGAALEFDMELVGVRRQRSSVAFIDEPPASDDAASGASGADDPASRLAKLREGRAAEAERRKQLAEKKAEAKRLAEERLANKGTKKGGGKGSKKRGK